MRLICLFAAVVLPLAGCSLLGNDAPPPVQADVLHPGDLLRITVAGEDELSGTFPVNEDRTVHLELLGAVPAGGLSVAAFEDILRKRLAEGYLKNPQVLVARAPAQPTPEQASAAGPASLPPPVLRQSQIGQ